MANKDDVELAKLSELQKKSSVAIYGTNDKLNNEDKNIENIIHQTIIKSTENYGDRSSADGVVNYFNQLNFQKFFAEAGKDDDKLDQNQFKANPSLAFKKYMSENDVGDATALLMAEQPRLLAYANYKAIYNHIPECATGLDIYLDNILSPDDLTKRIFFIKYESTSSSAEVETEINKNLKNIEEKYEIEDKAEQIIHNALLQGEEYVAVLSLENEMQSMLSDPIMKNTMLTESNINLYDTSLTNVEVNASDIEKDSNLVSILNEMVEKPLPLEKTEDNKSKKNNKKINEENRIVNEDVFNEETAREYIANLINKNVVVGSKKEFLLERFYAEKEDYQKKSNLHDVPNEKSKTKRGDKKESFSPFFLNGSSIKMLDSGKVVDLTVDNICYGYYYLEDTNNLSDINTSYLGVSSGREIVGNKTSMGANTITSMGGQKITSANTTCTALGISDVKLNLISKIFIDTLSKKLNREFIKKNKNLKDFIFQLVKQDYIIKKGLKITYFSPDEVVAFKVDPIYEKIVFFAKIYLAMLTNMLLIKMGRAHDKRVYYIDVGTDASYEQAVSKVIQDVKTKEFKMDSIGDINTILSLNPGRFDDFFIPTVNGEKPIEIETIAGMDTEVNNEFLEYLKNSCMSGMSIPGSLIDDMKDVDFARTLSARNANFLRRVVRYQKKFTMPFTKLIRILFKNEYQYNQDKKSEIFSYINIENIKVEFPSPATLNMTNIADQLQTAETNAEAISQIMLPPMADQSTDDERMMLKMAVLKDFLPSIDWDRMEEIKKRVELDKRKMDTKAAEAVKNNPIDPYGQGY